jgi:uncharacterized protein (TIGR02270 family)
MPDTHAGSLPAVVDLHVEEATGLYARRAFLTRGPAVSLQAISRADGRLTAHLDGIVVAGACGETALQHALAADAEGAIFTAVVLAVQDRDNTFLKQLFVQAGRSPETARELMSGLGWVTAASLQGLGVVLLGSTDPFERRAGIAACAMHRVDPGLISARRLQDPIPSVRARALRTSGDIGCRDAATLCDTAIRDDDEDCRFWASRSSVLLGQRDAALDALTRTGLTPGPHRRRGFRLAFQAMRVGAAHEALTDLAKESDSLRWLIQGAGIAGDPVYIPWLINHMADEKTARVAGEAFTIITGADIDHPQLAGGLPVNFESGPTDDPDDPNVEIDEDDGLPWPDPEKIEKWWAANAGRFQKGTRYFMGVPVIREHCIEVLKNGYQRQRILAAHYLCLLEPGTPLFNTSAPAWRQQRLLAKMT